MLVAYFKKEDRQTHDVVVRVLENQATAAVSAITVAELWSASEVMDETIRADRQAVLEFFEIVSVDEVLAKRGGELRRQLNLALPDALIAACAEQGGGRFLTKDPHFSRLVNIGILQGDVYE